MLLHSQFSLSLSIQAFTFFESSRNTRIINQIRLFGPFIAVLSDFILALQHVVVPISYVVCNDGNEPALCVCFFAAQSASASLDISDRTLVAAAYPAKRELVARSTPEYIFFPRRVSLTKNHVAISESVW